MRGEVADRNCLNPDCLAEEGERHDAGCTPEKGEMVEHPSHYGGDVPHEVIKCLEAWGLENDALLWNVVKYIGRAGKKGPAVEDLKKARFYLDRRIQSIEAG